jgi:hypothetical protein
VLYALAMNAAFRYLTDDEKDEFRRRKKIIDAKREIKTSLIEDERDLWLKAFREGADPESPQAQAQIRSLRLKRLNAPGSPFTPQQVQALLKAPLDQPL